MASCAPALDLLPEQLQAHISGKRQPQLGRLCASFGSRHRPRGGRCVRIGLAPKKSPLYCIRRGCKHLSVHEERLAHVCGLEGLVYHAALVHDLNVVILAVAD